MTFFVPYVVFSGLHSQALFPDVFQSKCTVKGWIGVCTVEPLIWMPRDQSRWTFFFYDVIGGNVSTENVHIFMYFLHLVPLHHSRKGLLSVLSTCISLEVPLFQSSIFHAHICNINILSNRASVVRISLECLEVTENIKNDVTLALRDLCCDRPTQEA